jgi:hypothetical protein
VIDKQHDMRDKLTLQERGDLLHAGAPDDLVVSLR